MGKPGGDSKLDKGEEGVGKGELVSPLAYVGREGGNPLSPTPVGYSPNPDETGTSVITPDDPLGLLPKDATGKGKRGGA